MIFNRICNTDHDVVSVTCWNCLLICQTESPMTQVYKKIATCSLSEMSLKFWWLYNHKFSQRWRKTGLWTPSSLWICSRWPLSNSRTYIFPIREGVWYGILLYKVLPYKTTCSITRPIKMLESSISSSSKSMSPDLSKTLLGVLVHQYSWRISSQSQSLWLTMIMRLKYNNILFWGVWLICNHRYIGLTSNGPFTLVGKKKLLLLLFTAFWVAWEVLAGLVILSSSQ